LQGCLLNNEYVIDLISPVWLGLKGYYDRTLLQIAKLLRPGVLPTLQNCLVQLFASGLELDLNTNHREVYFLEQL